MSRAMIVTLKEEDKRARMMWGPRLPPAWEGGVSGTWEGYGVCV